MGMNFENPGRGHFPHFVKGQKIGQIASPGQRVGHIERPWSRKRRLVFRADERGNCEYGRFEPVFYQNRRGIEEIVMKPVVKGQENCRFSEQVRTVEVPQKPGKGDGFHSPAGKEPHLGVENLRRNTQVNWIRGADPVVIEDRNASVHGSVSERLPQKFPVMDAHEGSVFPRSSGVKIDRAKGSC